MLTFHRRWLFLLSIGAMFLIGSMLPADSLLHQPDVTPMPFRAGEELVYKVKLRGFSAGEWRMQVHEDTQIEGQPVYHFESQANTTGFASKFYTLIDSQTSYVSKSRFVPLRYEKQLQDNSYKAEVQVKFQQEAGHAEQLYNGEQRCLEIPSGIQDELSMIYLLRHKDLNFGEKYEFDLLTLRKMYHVLVEMRPRERIETVLGKRETLVLRSTNGYQIWLTNDDRRIPVRIEAETKAGKLVGILEEIH